MESLFYDALTVFYHATKFVIAIILIVSVKLIIEKTILKDKKKFLDYLKNKPVLFTLCGIPFTYFLYGTVYLEDLIFSLVLGKEFFFTGCSNLFDLPKDIEKCFYLIPSNINEASLMFGKIVSSCTFFLLFYFIYNKKKYKN